MHSQCLKCEYVRTESDDKSYPEWKCPKCEAVYSKLNAPTIRKNSKRISKNKKSIITNIKENKLNYLVVFAIGFFAGREQIKYEIRNVMSSTLEKVSSTLTRVSNNLNNPENNNLNVLPDEQPQQAVILPVKFISKGFRAFNLDDGDQAIEFKIAITNTFTKDIRSVKGELLVTNLLNDHIKTLIITIDDPINSNSSLVWEGTMKYNQFRTSDKRLRAIETKNCKVSFAVTKVLFSDGTTNVM